VGLGSHGQELQLVKAVNQVVCGCQRHQSAELLHALQRAQAVLAQVQCLQTTSFIDHAG